MFGVMGSTKRIMDRRAHDVPFTTQTRLSFDVTHPLWAVVAPGDFLPRERASLVPPLLEQGKPRPYAQRLHRRIPYGIPGASPRRGHHFNPSSMS